MLGLLENAPEELQSCRIQLIKQNFDLNRNLNLKIVNFDFSGKISALDDNYLSEVLFFIMLPSNI